VSVTTSSKLQRRQSVVTERLPDGSGLLFDPDTAIAYPISESAVRIWELCDGVRDVSAIVDDLESHYVVDRGTLEADSLKLLADLIERRLADELPRG
jgi:hypothetical protein